MRCPKCGGADVRVIDSRESRAGDEVRRRRICGGCGCRFTTRERAEASAAAWRVKKRDGREEAFDERKLARSMAAAAGKAWRGPEGAARLEALAAGIGEALRRDHPEWVSSEAVGEAALRTLWGVDEAAGMRYESVLRGWKKAGEFGAAAARRGRRGRP
ncbi:MAG: transcriptional repressor NrdR [Kiritimatiellae bacterium]|nr:transcriptional repressor NrdR [Kiritimatiellia bacterium]